MSINPRLPRQPPSKLHGKQPNAIDPLTLELLVEDNEILTWVAQVMKEHGDEARLTAAMHADDQLASGNLAEFGIWMRIVQRIDNLERLEPTNATVRVSRGRARRRNLGLSEASMRQHRPPGTGILI